MLKNLLLVSLLITGGCSRCELTIPCILKLSAKKEINSALQETQLVEIQKTEPFLDPISCPLTPEVLEKMTMPPIYKSNNLRRRIGYSSEAKGEKIIISGIITDSLCRPIGNARVDIWQADSQGYYKAFQPNPYLNDQRLYKESSLRFTDNYPVSSLKADENFTGSGSMTSNNLGHFYFLTIKPGGKDGKKIYIRITHKSFPEFNSILFFPENNKVNILQKPDKILGSEEKNYYYKITLHSENSTKSY